MVEHRGEGLDSSSGILDRMEVLTVSAILLLFLLLATVAFFLTPTTYDAEARLAVGDQSTSAVQVPGYVNATSSLASNYSRYVQDTAEFRGTLPESGAGLSRVLASPIPDSSIILVEASADTAELATAAVSSASERLIAQVAASRPDVEAARLDFVRAYTAFRGAQARSDSPTVRASSGALSASADAATLDLQQQALGVVYRDAFTNAAKVPRVSVVAPASITGTQDFSTLQRYVLLAVVATVVVGVAYIWWRRRTPASVVPRTDGYEEDDATTRPGIDLRDTRTASQSPTTFSAGSR